MEKETGIGLVDIFISNQRHELNRSQLTVEAYERDVRQFAAWISSSKPELFEPISVTVGDIRAWIASLSRQGESNSTLRRKTQSLRAFFRFLMKRGIMKINPAADVTLAKRNRTLPSFIKETEMENILDEAGETLQEKRAHLVLNILYSLGLRQAELLAINDSDISFHAKELRVTGKGNKQRVIPLPDPLLKEISQWQSLRDSLPGNEGEGSVDRPLFPGRNGRLSKTTLYHIVENGLGGVSSEKKSPHTLRHTFATAMVNDGASLDTVREMLGHTSVATTQLYTHLSFEQLRRNYDSAHPRSKKNKDDLS